MFVPSVCTGTADPLVGCYHQGTGPPSESQEKSGASCLRQFWLRLHLQKLELCVSSKGLQQACGSAQCFKWFDSSFLKAA